MLPTKKNTKRRTLRGLLPALNCYYLTLIDPEFAESQYYSLVKAFYSDDAEDIFWGIYEYLQKRPRFKLDVDAGPIVFGLSASRTAFAIGAATFFNDWKTRSELLHTAEIAGQTVDDVSLILGMIVNLKIKPLEQDDMDSCSNGFFY